MMDKTEKDKKKKKKEKNVLNTIDIAKLHYLLILFMCNFKAIQSWVMDPLELSQRKQKTPKKP